MRYMEIEDKYIDRLTKKMNVAAKYGWEVVTTIFNGEEYIALCRKERSVDIDAIILDLPIPHYERGKKGGKE
jgi:hypothetical protein